MQHSSAAEQQGVRGRGKSPGKEVRRHREEVCNLWGEPSARWVGKQDGGGPKHLRREEGQVKRPKDPRSSAADGDTAMVPERGGNDHHGGVAKPRPGAHGSGYGLIHQLLPGPSGKAEGHHIPGSVVVAAIHIEAVIQYHGDVKVASLEGSGAANSGSTV